MAHLKLYQMYDTVAMQVTGPIIAANRDEVVTRQFTEVLARKETLPGQYPEDFALMVIGEQNQDSGELKPVDPQIIYTGRVWLRLQQLKADSSSPANTNTAGEPPPALIELQKQVNNYGAAFGEMELANQRQYQALQDRAHSRTAPDTSHHNT